MSMKITVNITNIASSNNKPNIDIVPNMIAPTLLARDYKGWSNYANAGVSIIEEE